MSHFSKLRETLRNREWEAFRKRRRARLKVTEFSILATNCTAGVLYHDLDLEFRTPTVNLTIPIWDFLKLAERPRWYLDQPLVEIPWPASYPVALLGGDVRVNFVHYATFPEAEEKWEARKRRVCWDRLLFMATDRGECDYETIRRFDRLPWPNKIFFTHRPYPEFPSACCIRGFEGQKGLGILTDFKPGRLKRRYLDAFDYVTFLNHTE